MLQKFWKKLPVSTGQVTETSSRETEKSKEGGFSELQEVILQQVNLWPLAFSWGISTDNVALLATFHLFQIQGVVSKLKSFKDTVYIIVKKKKKRKKFSSLNSNSKQ